MQTLSIIAAGIAIIVIVIFLGAILLQWLWNWTMPEVLGLKAIAYWQAVRLMLICQILIKGASVSSKKD